MILPALLAAAVAVPAGFFEAKLDNTTLEIHAWPPGWTVVRCTVSGRPQVPTVESPLDQPIPVCGGLLLVREGERIYVSGKKKRAFLHQSCGFRAKGARYGTFTSLAENEGGALTGSEVSIVPSDKGDMAVVTRADGSSTQSSVVPVKDGAFEVRAAPDQVLAKGSVTDAGVQLDGAQLKRGAFFAAERCFKPVKARPRKRR